MLIRLNRSEKRSHQLLHGQKVCFGRRVCFVYERSVLRRHKGSVSLMMALIMSALLIIFSIFFQAALYRSAQADLTRAMSAQIQTGLAAYDLELLHDFGLWGYRPEKIDATVFHQSLPASMRRQPMTLLPDDLLTESTTLETQIVTYMQARLPVIYMERLFSQLDDLSVSSQAPGQDQAIRRVSGWLSGLSSHSTKEAVSNLTNGMFLQLEDVAAAELDQLYRESASAIAGFEQDQALSGIYNLMPDFFDPASLAATADDVDQFLRFNAPIFYEKACVAEYVLNQFSSYVLIERSGGYTTPIRTINGRQMLNFPDDRTMEVEQIITGIHQPQTAQKIVQGMLISFRTIIHLAHVFTDAAQMKTIRGSAVAISAALAAVTAGSVVIDPETMTWLLAIVRSLSKGWSDVNRLRNGYSVAFWPGDKSEYISLYYRDYLRLYLIGLPRPLLLYRIGRRIDTVMQGPFFTAIEVRTNWRQQQLALKGSYP